MMLEATPPRRAPPPKGDGQQAKLLWVKGSGGDLAIQELAR